MKLTVTARMYITMTWHDDRLVYTATDKDDADVYLVRDFSMKKLSMPALNTKWLRTFVSKLSRNTLKYYTVLMPCYLLSEGFVSRVQVEIVVIDTYFVQDIDLKDKIFIPELYIYELLKYEAPEVLKKSESLTMSSSSNVRLAFLYTSYMLCAMLI